MPAENHRQPFNIKPMPRLLSIKEATFELGISRTSAYEMIAAGKLKTVKIGRRRLIAREAIDEFIASLSADGAGR
jgi:excisionase family DNA binding protein